MDVTKEGLVPKLEGLLEGLELLCKDKLRVPCNGDFPARSNYFHKRGVKKPLVLKLEGVMGSREKRSVVQQDWVVVRGYPGKVVGNWVWKGYQSKGVDKNSIQSSCNIGKTFPIIGPSKLTARGGDVREASLKDY